MKKIKTSLFFFVILTVTETYSTIDDSIRLCQHQLDSIKIQLDKLSLNFEELSRKETLTLVQLDAIDKKITLTQDMLKRLTTQIDLRNREINEVTAQLMKIDEQIRQRQEPFINTQEFIRYNLCLPVKTSPNFTAARLISG